MPPSDDLRSLTGELVAVGRRRWPGARFGRIGATVRWTDGPARPDLRAALTGAGITFDQLDRHGIRLERCFSPRVIATIAVATTDLPVRDTLAVADELTSFPIPANGPPPLRTDPDRLGGWWRRAGHLVARDQPRLRVPVDRDRVLHGAVLRARWLARALGPAALDAGPSPVWSPDVGCDTSALVPEEGSGPKLILPLRLPGWPDLEVVAVLPHCRCEDPREVGPPPEAELRWVDGPAPAQVLDLLERADPPAPLGGCASVTTARALSAVGVAAAVLLHQRVYGRGYRDLTASAHRMQRWKVATVREAERRGRPRRKQLEDLQAQLLQTELPPTDHLNIRAPGRNGHQLVMGGAQLWARAATLLAITRDREHDEGTAYWPASDPSRRLAVALARELEHIDERTLATMSTETSTRAASERSRHDLPRHTLATAGDRATVPGRTGDGAC